MYFTYIKKKGDNIFTTILSDALAFDYTQLNAQAKATYIEYLANPTHFTVTTKLLPTILPYSPITWVYQGGSNILE